MGGGRTVATKEELEKQNQELTQQVNQLVGKLQDMQNQRYEMLNRLYPYMANELDAFRAQQMSGDDGQ